MRRNEKGLTLVEVLAGIALLSMILLLASSIHLFAQKQMNTQKEDIQIQSNERLAFNRITGEIRKAEKVDDLHPNILLINDTDEYKLVGTTLELKGDEKITNIDGFSVEVIGKQVKLKIGNIPETTIYIRGEK